MARMIPSQPDPDTPGSERRVFECLADALPHGWVVFHSRRFTVPARPGHLPAEHELDFLVVSPDRGLLGIEVKGGTVGRDTDGWYSVDRHGETHRVRDPGAQVQHSIHRVADYLRQHPRLAHREPPAFGWCVCLPDGRAPRDLGPGLPRARVLDAEDLASPWSAVNRVLASALGEGSALDAGTIAAIVEALAPTFRVTPSLASLVAQSEAALVRLTEEQLRVLDYFSAAPRVGITGAAGTGKTIVAMERASRLAAEGLRVLLLCYNKALGDHLARRARGFRVSTFHAFCRDMAEQAGIATSLPADPEQLRQFYEVTAPQHLMNALSRIPGERFDAVIVDEGQDFAEMWWVAIEDLLRDRRSSSLWVFYDPRQDIFGRDGLRALDLSPVELTFNCRNTEAIAVFAHHFVGSAPRLFPQTPRGCEVETVACASQDAMRQGVRRAIHRLATARFDASRIVVLSPRNPNRSQLAGHVYGNYRLAESPSAPNEVRLASLQSFKGLETDALILAEVDRAHVASSPMNLYVAASRAKHVLVFLEYAPGALAETPASA